ncbi:DUF2147 domain-containing protein [Luteirhabdus pelagi]|uniref:DUF2147 domain-containing protein n=1 Tax=Luteirhabdus pelagi TaxID=2792783 RepID=UPI001939E1DA|nr:DUF2147 domain-containing protein [Luteirhabdus pelagi]
MMKELLFSGLLTLVTFGMFSQDVIGEWKNFNSEGEVRSIVKIFESGGLVHGKVVRIMDEEDRDDLCVHCEGEQRNKKIEGLVLMRDFQKEGDVYVNGTITNPDNGKVYRSRIWVDEDDPNTLNVRGYIGFFYKTMQWERISTSP